MEIDTDGETVVMGILDDAVREVFDLDHGAIELPTKIGARLYTSFIKGMGKYADNFVILLDIDRIFSAGEAGMVASIQKSAA